MHDENEWQLGDAPTCNEDLVRNLMNFNPAGLLCQGFIMTAIMRYAEQCAAADPRTFDNAFVNGEQWVRCAKHIKDECDKFYGRHNQA